MSNNTTVQSLLHIAATLSSVVSVFEQPSITDALSALEEAAVRAQKSWSGSNFGYHSRVYYKDFMPPPAGAIFSSEWGFLTAFSNPTKGNWIEYAWDDAIALIKRLAGDPDLSAADSELEKARAHFDEAKAELISLLSAFLSQRDDPVIKSILDEAKTLSHLTYDEAVRGFLPSGTTMTRDSAAYGQGIHAAPHQVLLARVISLRHASISCSDLEKMARRSSAHIDRLLGGAQVLRATSQGDRVFIGHGRSPQWRELKDFLQDRLGLAWDEFNRIPVAGVTNIARLADMLDNAGIALLVLTAEDEQRDGALHARLNVIHEAGLFQGRLGFSRAIVLLEEGCEEFSNIQGLGQIRFPSGNITAAFEEVRRVLEREKFIPERH